MEAADLELFERSLRHATETHRADALDAALDDVGWHDARSLDERVAVSLLFDLQGRANTTSSALDHLVVGRKGAVLPALGASAPPGTLDGDLVRVRGLATSASGTVVVVASAGDKEVAATVEAVDLETRRVHGVDPSLGLVEVTGEAAVAGIEPIDWDASTTLAHLALGHELVGASRRMLELAREHAVERIQFGQPIARFQAVRHRLAETLVAIETAEAVLDAAWQDGSPVTAAMAKAVAGRGARIASRHCQQVCAGIGFTTEHPLHLYVRRVLVLDELFGAARTLTSQLGTDLLRTRQLPPLPPL